MYGSNYPSYQKGQPTVNTGGNQYLPLDLDKSTEKEIELRNSYYSEKVDHHGGGYLHPIFSANRA